MYCSKVYNPSTKHAASQLLRSYSNTSALRVCLTTQPHIARDVSTSVSRLKSPEDFFPAPKESPAIAKVEGPWPHPIYTDKQMRENIRVAHRKAENWSDYIALGLVRTARWGMDVTTGFKHDVPNPNTHPGDKDSVGDTKVGKGVYTMSEKKWLKRFIFLESVAGVPGMVAGMLRHLRSIRRLKRDNGWIETLLEEAFNERMHLLTFLKLAEPSWFMKVMILGAQGVFFNAIFLSYIISPRTVHRFVGYLEEEAVHTYSLAISDLQAGLLPEWSKTEAPEIAVQYWEMPEGKRTMYDLLLYIRADEAKHREVNHTLGNLEQDIDPNPFVSRYVDPTKPHPGKGLENLKATGWERTEVIKG